MFKLFSIAILVFSIHSFSNAEEYAFIKGADVSTLAQIEDSGGVFTENGVAKDALQIFTSDVKEVMQQFDIPGMRVLLFGFSGDLAKNVHLPHNLVKKSVLFTGTHDNNTIRGWFENDATEKEKKQLYRYFGRKIPKRKLHWEFIRLAMMSVAEVAIFSMQDILGLGEKARMNRPFINEGNWLWGLRRKQLKSKLATKLVMMVKLNRRI